MKSQAKSLLIAQLFSLKMYMNGKGILACARRERRAVTEQGKFDQWLSADSTLLRGRCMIQQNALCNKEKQKQKAI